ncbi:MAG: glycosyltransferase family 2 protein [Proteobacteria bacterium]|nr:glycosyltransferase family 2 protein [Pseudomonadota bacterium]MBU1641560.1 glycosyltransferase family 2 protein [Pseudomonadota bacterium]
MSSPPIVTVVIPAYNHQDYVGQAIESVLDQSWPAIDLIVIDDGSTDKSVSVINDILGQRGGFRFIHGHPNQGLMNSLNMALELATGVYFCELASDDFLPKDSVEKRVLFLEEHADHVAVFTDGFSVQGNTLTDHHILDAKRRLLFTAEDPIPLLLQGTLPVFATGLFRTKTMRDLGGFDPHFRCYEDLEMPVLLCRAGKIGQLPEPLFCRREHGTNTSTSTPTIKSDKIYWYQKLLANPDFAEYTPILRRELQRAYLRLGRHLTATRGGTAAERVLFQGAWPYAHKDIRLLYHLLKWRKKA